MSAPAHRGRSTLTCANAPGGPKWASGRLPSVERVLFAPRELPPLPPDVSQDPGAYAHLGPATRGGAGRPLPAGWAGPPGARHAGRRRAGGLGGPVPAWPARPDDSSLAAHADHHRTAAGRAGAARPLEPAMAGPPPPALGRRPGGDAIARTPAARPEIRGGCTGRRSLFPGDVWAPDAVALLGDAVTPQGVVYADEDTQRDGGSPELPRLKPDYSPDFLLSTGYVGRPLAIGSGLLPGIGDYAAIDLSSLEYECALDVCGRAASVIHLPEVLCHRDAPGRRSTGRDRTAKRRARRTAKPSAAAPPGNDRCRSGGRPGRATPGEHPRPVPRPASVPPDLRRLGHRHDG